MDDKSKIAGMVIEERKFLHDISNKLLIASSFAEFVNRYLQKLPEADEKIKQKQEKSFNAMKDMVEAVKSHKQMIMAKYGDYKEKGS